MKKRAAAIALTAALWTVAAAGSASAGQALSGPVDLRFNVGFGDAATTCPQFTWAGTVELSGNTYWIAYVPTDLAATGAAFHFEEGWFIYETWNFEFVSGVLTSCTGDIVMEGTDAGVTSPNRKAHGNGEVTWVDPAGPFDSDLTGNRTKFSGEIAESFVEFTGEFRVN